MSTTTTATWAHTHTPRPHTQQLTHCQQIISPTKPSIRPTIKLTQAQRNLVTPPCINQTDIINIKSTQHEARATSHTFLVKSSGIHASRLQTTWPHTVRKGCNTLSRLGSERANNHKEPAAPPTDQSDTQQSNQPPYQQDKPPTNHPAEQWSNQTTNQTTNQQTKLSYKPSSSIQQSPNQHQLNSITSTINPSRLPLTPPPN